MKSRIAILAVAVGMCMSTVALADSNDGPTINGCGGGNCNINSPSTTSNTTNNQGGTGVGVGVGIGVGKGGNAEVKNSGNSFNANSNKNKNTNVNSNRQGQLQGQQQGQSSTNIINIGGGSEGQGGELASSTASVVSAPSASVSVEQPSQVEIKTPGVASVPNIYPTSPCMGSTSAGVSFMGGAVSGGTSWKDDDCSFRETARMFDQLGYKADGLAVMCESAYAKNAPSCKKLAAQAKAEADAEAAKVAAANAAAAQQVAARESARQEEKRKTDATVRTSSTIEPTNAETNVWTNAVDSTGAPVRSGFSN